MNKPEIDWPTLSRAYENYLKASKQSSNQFAATAFNELTGLKHLEPVTEATLERIKALASPHYHALYEVMRLRK